MEALAQTLSPHIDLVPFFLDKQTGKKTTRTKWKNRSLFGKTPKERFLRAMHEMDTNARLGALFGWGAVIPEGITVLDFDRHVGMPDGFKTWDKMRTMSGGALPTISELQEHFPSVTTPSDGLHIYASHDGHLPLLPGTGIDVLNGGAHLIMLPCNVGYRGVNETTIDDLFDPKPLPEEVAETIIGWANQQSTRATVASQKRNQERIDPGRAREILTYVQGYDDRDTWLKIGMGLHDEFGNDLGFEVWDEWSRQSDKHDSMDSVRVWNSFGKEGITFASVMKLAIEGGYRPRFDRYCPSTEGADARLTQQEPSAETRPIVILRPGETREVLKETEAAMIQNEALEQIFQREDQVVRIINCDNGLMPRPGVQLPQHCAMLTQVQSHYLAALFEEATVFVKLLKKGATSVPCPSALPITYLQSAGQWLIPRIRAIIHAPTLRPDATVIQTPGLDTSTGIYYDPAGIDFPEVPDSPTLEDAREAIHTLLKPVRLF